MFWSNFLIWAEKFILEFSYLAVFLVSLIGTSTLFIPFPFDSIIVFAASGLGLNPVLVGVFAGLGAATGELSGYFVGAGGRVVIGDRKPRYKFLEKFIDFFTSLFKKYGLWIIPIFAFLPFPFDIVGILCGMAKYDVKKFWAAVATGRILRAIMIAYLGHMILPSFTQWVVSQ
jgi:membrane protein DedA with SNARE-associated domain